MVRRDVFIMNDSGGFSVLAASAAPAIINESLNELEYVMAHQVLLLELYGDDSMPVRLVVDEPLLPEEEAQWLAHVAGRLEIPDGQLLVMGGFDPDVLAWWQEDHAPDEDGTGVAVVQVAPGSWLVNVYAHVGSMNGRQILSQASEKPGSFFRRCYPERAFPIWLAQMLEYSGEDDPGYEDLWQDVAASVAAGQLNLDLDAASAIGFLVHITPATGSVPELAPAGWFDYDAGQRIPDMFPLGLTAAVADPELESFLDRILSRPRPVMELPAATQLIGIIETWVGEPLQPLIGGGPRPLAPTDVFQLYWTAALCADSSPRFELWVTTDPSWTPPAASPECAVINQNSSSESITWALGAPPNAGGWFMWNAAQIAASGLMGIPDGATLVLAMAPDPDDDGDPAVGRALYSGQVQDGIWQISEASPAVRWETLDAALSFVADLVEQSCISVQGADEQRVLEATAAMYLLQNNSLVWDGEAVRLAEPDQRMLIMLAEPVFRTRFAGQWPSDPIDTDDEW